MKKEKKLDVVFILDKSGSMGGSEEHTISSYNEYLEKNKNNSYKTNITTCLFSDQFSYLYKSTDIKKTKKITKREYYVEGCTALYDAIGSTINYIDSIDTDKVMFVNDGSSDDTAKNALESGAVVINNPTNIINVKQVIIIIVFLPKIELKSNNV